MNPVRSILLAASQNVWLRDHAARHTFVRRAVSRFMPGEELSDALAAAQRLQSKNIASIFTRLGENITDEAEARSVAKHYLEVLRSVREQQLDVEISVKLTQLGLDLSPELCYANLKTIIEQEDSSRVVWIDMEASNYVDDNYFLLAKEMLLAKKSEPKIRAAFGTHDMVLLRRISEFAAASGLPKTDVEVQMLYGIQSGEQERLASEGYRSKVLVSYGSHWYTWFMRRLAERPANLWFVARNLFHFR
jgi:proline dehydrogenase